MKDTSGPAFPCKSAIQPIRNASGQAVGTYEIDGAFLEQGMTLRDYFAAKAMQAQIASAGYRFNTSADVKLVERMAGRSYIIADAMLVERSK